MGARKELPEVWKRYLKRVRQKLPNRSEALRFAVLDTETTGLDYYKDRILSIGVLRLEGGTIAVDDCLEIDVEQERFNKETVPIHGILKEGRRGRVTEREALEQLLDYLGNDVLVAHHALFDLTMINNALNRNGLPNLKNPYIDTARLFRSSLSRHERRRFPEQSGLDELTELFSIDRKDRHTALGDALITAYALLHILGRLGPLTTSRLLKKGRKRMF